MPDATTDEKLRAMAEHRGLKLVKSRRRKPGTGDFGRYGLTDADGKALLGIGDKGLTASPEDIEAYLRAGATSTWKASADTTPARSKSAPKQARAQSKPPPTPASPPAKREKKLTPAPLPAPELVIRPARPADAAALKPLLKQLAGTGKDVPDIAHNLITITRLHAGMIVAELHALIGCCGWAIIPTLQHGLIGRLTVLLVDDAHRRRGIATALLAAATDTLRKAGCTNVEAMSDIEIKNAHNFFRALKFEQTSYRFVRAIETERVTPADG